MILQALCDYYHRKAALGEMPPYGREWKPIPYLIIIDSDGNFIRLEPTYEGEGKDKRAKKYLVARSRGRTGQKSWTISNLLWDHYGYVFGFPKKMDFNNAKLVDTGKKQCGVFQQEIKRLMQLNPNNDELLAVNKFYEHLQANIEKLKADGNFDEAFKKDGTNFAFKLVSGIEPVGTAPHFNYGTPTDEAPQALCLVTGTRQPIAITNSSISLRNGNPTGCVLVGFQRNSGYDSYHKEQGMNAPISQQANYAYTTALSTLLAPQSKNKFFFNKDTLVFWADRDNPMEDVFASFFAVPPKDDPNRGVKAITALMKAPLTGSIGSTSSKARFYLLQLSPNSARIAVKLWEESSVDALAENMRRYFDDLDIVHGAAEPPYMPLNSLLRSIALQGKEENLPPQLFQEMMRAIIHNLPLPELLQSQTLGRIKADRSVTRNRAALLKAYLNRKPNNNEIKITMSLNLQNNNQAYLCGRLFAVYEKMQQEALGSVNTSVRDRFYDSFSSTPNVALHRLDTLSVHHLQKLSQGRQIYFEKLKGEIIDKLNGEGLPHHFSLDDQSRFAIGYYQQRQQFFVKKQDAGENQSENK